VPSRYDRSESELLDSNDTRSFTSSQRNRRFSSFGSPLSAATSVGSDFVEEMMPRHKCDFMRIESEMQTFVKNMVRGKEMCILSVDGELTTCTCSFDRKLRNYNLLISKKMRSISLAWIKEVFQGVEPLGIATPLDELCATIMLKCGEHLSFRFAHVKERECFSLCLQMVVDGIS